jgi:hypothetical protein
MTVETPLGFDDLFAAPWIDASALCREIDKQKIPGVRFRIPGARQCPGETLATNTARFCNPIVAFQDYPRIPITGLSITFPVPSWYTIIRSATHKLSVHEKASYLVMSGHEPLATVNYPSMGAVAYKELGARNELPPNVTIRHVAEAFTAHPTLCRPNTRISCEGHGGTELLEATWTSSAASGCSTAPELLLRPCRGLEDTRGVSLDDVAPAQVAGGWCPSGSQALVEDFLWWWFVIPDRDRGDRS